MTVDLCRDVERFILDKLIVKNTMMYIVVAERIYDDRENHKFEVFRLTRNMLDPVWHVVYKSNQNDAEILCRNRRVLEHLIRRQMPGYQFDDVSEILGDTDLFSYYSQGETLPANLGKNIVLLSEWYSDCTAHDFFTKMMNEIEIMIATA